MAKKWFQVVPLMTPWGVFKCGLCRRGNLGLMPVPRRRCKVCKVMNVRREA
jgi:hypothetical protein